LEASKPKKKKLFTPLEKKAILGLSLIFFFRMFGLFLILPVFSLLASEELAFSTPMLVGLAMGGYGLTSAILQIPFGAWSDKIGRKPVITFALILFIVGSVMAALSTDIYWMIFARLLQGAGAMSAPIFALIADLTRPEVRARANAGLGASVGMSFGIAMVFAPLLASWVGLSGIFWVIAGMATVGLALLWFVVPNPEVAPVPSTAPFSQMIKTVLAKPQLMTINIGAFTISMGLSATFFMLPFLLRDNGWDKGDWWKIYVTMLLAGGVTMMSTTMFAEIKNKFKQVMLVGVVMMAASFVILGFAWQDQDFILFMVAIYLFFMGFNIFEPIFPSLVTRLTTGETKGTASGVYNFSQFAGQFAGATLAGMFFHDPRVILPAILGVGSLVFLYRCLSFANPEKRVKKQPVEEPEASAPATV